VLVRKLLLLLMLPNSTATRFTSTSEHQATLIAPRRPNRLQRRARAKQHPIKRSYTHPYGARPARGRGQHRDRLLGKRIQQIQRRRRGYLGARRDRLLWL
jgi:hypothetical protein